MVSQWLAGPMISNYLVVVTGIYNGDIVLTSLLSKGLFCDLGDILSYTSRKGLVQQYRVHTSLTRYQFKLEVVY